MARATIYEAAGGAKAFERLAAAHHERCLADPVLNHPFSHPGQHPHHVLRLGAYWAEVLGGPSTYSETMGTEVGVLRIHAHNGATDDLPERFLACFVASFDDAGIPDDPELRAALRDYMAWATAHVHEVSPKEAVVPAVTPVPRWGWDGLISS